MREWDCVGGFEFCFVCVCLSPSRLAQFHEVLAGDVSERVDMRRLRQLCSQGEQSSGRGWSLVGH
jgi:hypothetical protein